MAANNGVHSSNGIPFYSADSLIFNTYAFAKGCESRDRCSKSMLFVQRFDCLQ